MPVLIHLNNIALYMYIKDNFLYYEYYYNIKNCNVKQTDVCEFPRSL